MKAGKVVYIRINPKDCQSILDLMDLINVDPYDGRGFPQCVSLALSSMLDTFRKNGLLPLVDEFQYLNRMGPLLGGKNDKRKYAASEQLYRGGGKAIGSLSLPQADTPHPGQYVPDHLEQKGSVGFTESGATRSAAQPLLLDEETLNILRGELASLYERLNAGETLSAEEQVRFDYLNKTLFP